MLHFYLPKRRVFFSGTLTISVSNMRATLRNHLRIVSSGLSSLSSTDILGHIHDENQFESIQSWKRKDLDV